MTRSLAMAFVMVLTVLAAGSAWGANLLIARMVAVDGPVPETGPIAESRPMPSGPARPRAMTQEQYIDGIMARNLFDVAMIDAWAARSPSAGPDLARTELRVKLVGTLVVDPAEYSSALIADEATPNLPSAYAVGDKLQEREVVSIEKDRVGLKRGDGTIEYLTMDNAEMPVAAATDGETPVGEGISPIGDNKFAVNKDLFDKYISDPESIAGLGRALLHRGPDGEYDGYRLSAIRRNTMADQLGIKNGDIIKSVNGQPLNSVQSAMTAYNTMRSEASFCFEISRRGSPQQLCYEVR